MTADERRAAVLRVARREFAKSGFHGTSTERIAEGAGVSQPYLFRLFGTKKDLFLACVRSGFESVRDLFERAAEGHSGEDALSAMGQAYIEMLQDRDKLHLQAQLQAYAAACADPDVRDAVRAGFGNIVTFVERVSGVPPVDLSRFMAQGMLLNVIGSMDLLDSNERWAKDLIEGCKEGSAA